MSSLVRKSCPGSPVWGTGGPEFKSRRSDQNSLKKSTICRKAQSGDRPPVCKPFADLFSISPSLCLASRRDRAPRQSPEPIQPPSDDYINERDHQTAEDPTGVPSAS